MRRFLDNFFSVIPLTVLSAALVTSIYTGEGWVVAIGILAAGIITWQSIREKTIVTTHGNETHRFDLARLDPAQAKKFRTVLKKRDQILEALGDLDETPFLDVEHVTQQVDDLVQGYYDLLVKLARIKPFLTRNAIAAARKSQSELKKRIARTSDEVTRRNLATALRSKTDEVKRLHDLKQFRKRLNSQLTSLIAALNSIHVRIVQLEVSAEAPDRSMEELSSMIDDLVLDAEISERVEQELTQVLSRTPPLNQR